MIALAEAGTCAAAAKDTMADEEECLEHDERNGLESDVDCGGEDCAKCADGARCRSDVDCSSGMCDLRTDRCVSCFNGVLDGDEMAAFASL